MSTSQKEIWQTHQGKIKFSVIEKNISISYLKPKLLAENLREEAKNRASPCRRVSMLIIMGLCIKTKTVGT